LLRAPLARVFARGFERKRFLKGFWSRLRARRMRAVEDSHPGMKSEDRGSVFAFVPTDSPAAIRRLGTTGKAPV
jgi:hypothetical protein